MIDKKSYVYLRFITLTLLVIGGLSWGVLGATGTNPISRISRALNIPYLSRVVYSMVGIAALLFIIKFYNRDTFLPFLGKTIMPPSLINLGYPLDFDYQATLTAPKGAKYVVYWASQGPAGQGVKDAYGKYENSGAMQVKGQKTVIKFKSPASYKVRGKTLKEHVHYRWVGDDGMMSRVHTLHI